MSGMQDEMQDYLVPRPSLNREGVREGLNPSGSVQNLEIPQQPSAMLYQGRSYRLYALGRTKGARIDNIYGARKTTEA